MEIIAPFDQYYILLHFDFDLNSFKKSFLHIETILELKKLVYPIRKETIGTISMLLIEHSRAINTSASILTPPYQSLSIGK